jgi:hypothetical protein
VLFGCDSHAAFRLLKFEHCDDVACHELSRDRPTNQRGEFVAAQGYVLFNLDNSKLVPSAFA